MIRRWRGVPAALLAVALMLAPLPFGSVTLGWLTVLRIAIAVLAFGGLLALPDLRMLHPLRGSLAAVAALAGMAALQGALWSTPWTTTLSPYGSQQAALGWLFVGAAVVAGGGTGLNRSHRPVLLGGLIGGLLLQLFIGVQLWRAGASRLWGVDMPGTAARLRGTFVNPDHLATLLEISLACIFAWSWWALRSSWRPGLGLRTSVSIWAPPLGLWFVTILGLALTGSRAGLMAAGFGTAAQGVLLAVGSRRSLRWAPAGLLLFAAGLGYVAFTNFEAGFGRWVGTSSYQVTYGQRRFAYEAAVELWKRFPIVGTGLGSFRDAFPLTQPPELAGGLWDHAHNDWLELLATGGLVGVVILLAGLAATMLGLTRTLRRGRRSADRAVALAALGAIFSIGVHAVFDFGLTMPANQLTLAVLVGAGLCAPRRRRQTAEPEPSDGPDETKEHEHAGQRPPRAKAPTRRLVAAVAALVLITGAATTWFAWQRSRADLDEFLDHSLLSLLRPTLADELAREPDAVKAKLVAARAFVAMQLDPRWILAVAEDDRRGAMRRSIETLEEVRTLAADTLERRPASWEAELLLGAAGYLGAVRDPATRPVARMGEWEPALQRARETAPGNAEATRYLAYAYVGEWGGLSPSQREAATPLLREAFENASTFERLLEPWLDRADPEEAMSVVPDAPHAWLRLQERYARQGQWERVADARRRWRALWPADFRQRFNGVKARVEGGDVRRGRDQYRAVASWLKVDGENVGLLQGDAGRRPCRSLYRLHPPGPRSVARVDTGALLHQPLPFHRARDHAPRSRRGSRAQRRRGLRAARFRRSAGRELRERRSEQTWTPDWGRYHVAHAAALTERDDLRGARAALLQVSPEWQENPTYWQVRLAVAEAEGDNEWTNIAQQRLADLSRDAWPGDEAANRMTVWKKIILPTLRPAPWKSLPGLADGAAGSSK